MNISHYLRYCISLFFLLFLSFSSKAQCSQPDGTIVVTSDADEGAGSLREAIVCANQTPGPNRVIFNIPTSNRAVILVGSTSNAPLPTLSDPQTIIDGSSQNGFGDNANFEPKIILDGSFPTWDAPIDALKITGDSTEIYALEIRNFPDDGIDVEAADEVVIGATEKGNIIYNCGIEQDFFPATGTQGPFNGVGIVVSSNAENTAIIGNTIGTDYAGNPNLGNEWVGIYLRFGTDFAIIEDNIITDNEIGIRLRNTFGIHISENQLSCNTLTGIQFVDGANDDKVPPSITVANNIQVTGTGNIGDEIEVFVASNCPNSPCQGAIFLGRTVVQSDRTWGLSAPYLNGIAINGTESITTNATDANGRTSTFSACQAATFEEICSAPNGVITVTNTNDDGPGSLRFAINCANEIAGPNTIQFNIAGAGRHQINVGSATGDELPFLRDANTVIDGTTQPGFGQNGDFTPLIVLDGSFNTWTFPHNALWLRADNCEIYSLEIRNFPDDGIDITGGDFNIIGAPNKGNVIYNCGDEKDFFEDSPNTGPWNGCGIVLKNGAQNSIIQGNIIGTDFTQTLSVGNELCGIIVQSNGNNNQIGGTNPGEENIIAYNLIGINIRSGAFNNRMLGNQFYCNTNSGIALSGDGNNAPTPPSINTASVNLLNGNGQDGDIIEIFATSNNCIDGPCQGENLIGRTTVNNQSWQLEAPFFNNTILEAGDRITAIATTPSNNSSEFSDCATVAVDTPPIVCTIQLAISNFSNETCRGNDGTFTLSASNAAAPISYDDGNGPSDSPNFTNLSAGVYTIVATDANGCSATLSVVITQQSSPSLNIISTNNENCGATDGSIALEAIGGQSPYIYELEGRGLSRIPVFNNLTAGEYVISVIDANNCTASQSVTIQQTGNINVSISDMRSDNCNSSSGSFRLAPSGGQAPYSFDIGNGLVSSNEFSGLSVGVYSVTISDVNNCSTVANVEISGSVAPSIGIDNINQTSCNQPTGSVLFSVSNGTAPFQYNLGEGNTNSPLFSDLSAGDYVLTVTDANDCIATQTITINEPSSPSLSVVSTQNASCGNANGQVSVLSAGGQAPYLYDIGLGISTNPNFNGLAGGNYVITVTDNNGCQDEMEVEIENSPIPTLTIDNIQNASCDLNNAIISVNSTGTRPFTYDIGNGPTEHPVFTDLAAGIYTVSMSDGNNCTASITVEVERTGGPQINIQSTSEARCNDDNGSFTVSAVGGFAPYSWDIGNGPTSNPVFNNLKGGSYVVTLTDNSGCTATQSVTLGNLPSPTFGIGNIIDASCSESNGGFTVSAFGGTAPYQFNIGGGNTTNPVFTDLKAGIYTIVVTDANSCSTALGVTIEGTEIPEVTITNQTPTECGIADGGFTANTIGGLAPYFYDIGAGETTNPSFSNLTAGNHLLTITDATGCSQVKEVFIEGSGEIAFLIADQLPVSCGQQNGAFTIIPQGGAAPYSFIVNNQAFSNPSFTDLQAGIYRVQVIDANDCSTQQIVEIEENSDERVPSAAFELSINNNQIALVNETIDGTQYIWNFGDGNETFSTNAIHNYAQAGNYTICLTATNECGQDTHCEAITIQAENTQNSFEFDFGKVTGTRGEIIKIPVYVKNFNSIVGFQKSVQIEDTTVARFVSISDVNLDDLAIGLFNIQDFEYSVSWFDGSIEGINLPDSTIIYQLTLELLSDNECTDITLTDTPIPTQVYKKIGNDEVEVEYFERFGTICPTGISNVKTANITGQISTELNLPISQVTIECTDTPSFENREDGSFSIPNLSAPKQYTLTPIKDTHPLNGISTFDLVVIQNHILGNNQITSPYKMIAADVNNSGAVTVADVLELRRLIIMNIENFTNNTSWRFIPRDYEFEDASNPFLEEIPSSTTLNLIDGDLDAAFIGIKIGDVNENALPNQLSNAASRNQQAIPFYLHIKNRLVKEGEIVEIPVSANNLEEIVGFQFEIHIDETKANLLYPPVFSILKEKNIGTSLMSSGYLLGSWNRESEEVFSPNSPLFLLKLEIKKDSKLSDLIELKNNFLHSEAYDNEGNIIRLSIDFGRSTLIETVSAFELFQNRPNPFKENTVIEYVLPQNGLVQLEIMDIKGTRLFTTQQAGLKGKNHILIEQSDLLGSGLFFYKINTPFGQKMRKMMVLR